MKNLKNLNLVELNAQEVKEIDGGIAPALVIGDIPLSFLE